MKRIFSTLLPLLAALTTFGQTRLDSIARLLADAPVQEKVYLHLDNTCYFKGDTIWYKSYVVRADNLNYTDMSHILYVELVSPDGLVVERQNLIVSADGYGDGNFALKDSLYSGYYELRAYTRWMLNFCVTEHPFNRTDREQFFNRQMAKDFFRQFGTVYSRVVPVYERPDSAGDYSQKYIVSRPKTRLDKEQKEKLSVSFYPEGGHLIGGTRCTVAFEARSEDGELVEVEGRLEAGNHTQPIATQFHGRGTFSVDVPESGRLKARFNYHGKDYSFDLPKTERTGCAVRMDAVGDQLTVDVTMKGIIWELGLAVLCRGVLKHFQTIDGNGRVVIDKSKLPTGVCDLIIFDETGAPLADRLFFVNHHDYDAQPVKVSGMETDYEPYAPITLTLQAPPKAGHISVSVRDGATDEPTYDTGNMMTELLLSSDLRGFIAYPDYYFEADDQQHRQALDLLMMVQGWRRYDYGDIVSQAPLRYQPEKNMTVEGAVYKTVTFDELRECEVDYWQRAIFGYCPQDTDIMDQNDPMYRKYVMALEDQDKLDDLLADTEYQGRIQGQNTTTSMDGSLQLETVGAELTGFQEFTPQSATDSEYGVNHGGLRHEVTVEGELVLGEDVATVEMETTDGGRFAFNVPPYYGDGILFLSAHKTDISEKKLKRLENKGRLDEDAWPEYYVKRDLFFPIFAKKYDYYQCHQPDADAERKAQRPSDKPQTSTFKDDLYGIDIERISSMDKSLGNVDVKARRRRGRHAIDYTKPACVYDAYELYNLATDYGLSFGKLNFRRFPIQVSMLLLGNYNSERFFNVQGRMNNRESTPYIFYRNFVPDAAATTTPFVSNLAIAKNLLLKRLDEIRLFSDFELRNEDKPIEQAKAVADVTLEFVTFPDEGMQYTYRDRRIILHGMYEPADFYHPDYSRQPLPEGTKDYRRTLYWNPNAKLDDDGRFTATFYNNGKSTRIRVSTAGVFPVDGVTP